MSAVAAREIPGFGDVATWPAPTGGLDPRVDVDDDAPDYDHIGQELIDIGRSLMAEAEKARTDPDFVHSKVDKLLAEARELIGDAL